MAPGDPKAKKGRPSKSSLAKLEEEGRNDENAKHKCRVCDRVFPRKKSKDAHLRTHFGLKPFKCDFPGCRKAFAQSSHLSAHIYLHTGEKPFACPARGCKVRYPHSNRRCSRHKLKLIRDGKEVIRTDLENLSEAVIQWLQLQKDKKFAKATKVSNPKTSSTKVRNVKREKSVESVHVDEKPFDKEPFPVKSSSPVPMNNNETSGYGSQTSSNPSTSPDHNPEEMNICDSSAQPPKEPPMSDQEVALLLIRLSNCPSGGIHM